MILLKQPLSRTEIYNSVETSVNSDGEHSKSLADEEGDYAEASELYSRSLEIRYPPTLPVATFDEICIRFSLNLFLYCSLKKLSTKNFDDVLVPEDHVSRSYNDTYYAVSHMILRCHTSAHQAELLRKGHTHFLITGDVYRRDSIDSTHYPIFHQMEGFRIFNPEDWEPSCMEGMSYAAEDLKKCLEGKVVRSSGLWSDIAGNTEKKLEHIMVFLPFPVVHSVNLVSYLFSFDITGSHNIGFLGIQGPGFHLLEEFNDDRKRLD
ncbi:hypothetical protein RHSIM_Rhsim08G0147200 [Rhododendron simsii]|uniref:Phenylalanyl-tRNA synthetase domain-containing protein n=1 Tax=Rhododendron simsii TaxID=118357 RepID=A0A834GK44_RHOSS|nr:hypothetical protein RHSIM_Rhsim08G0147200 [Rhododendron simsii]